MESLHGTLFRFHYSTSYRDLMAGQTIACTYERQDYDKARGYSIGRLQQA
jgi:hypothetical protein